MRMRKDLLVGAIALTCLAGAAQANSLQNSSQTQPQMHSTAPGLQHETTGQSTGMSSQLNLTAQQKQQIFHAAQSLPQQNAQSASLTPGSKVPSSVKLSAMPQQAKQSVGSTLQNAEIAKLQNGDVIVVNSSNKTVQAVITPAEANSTTGAGTGLSSQPSTSK